MISAEAYLALAAFAIWAVAILVRAVVLALAAAHPGLTRRRAAQPDLPPLSVLVPVKLVDTAFDEALVALLRQDYPDYETVICGDAQSEAAFAAARAIAAVHPDAAIRFVTATEAIGPNPKINNLAAAVATTGRPFLLIKDSNIVMAPDELRRLVSRLAPGVGMVCAIPLASRPETLAATVERAVMNGHGAPLVLAGAALGLDIGYGKVMLVRRADFDRIEALRLMAPHFGDDHALAKGLAAIGLRTIFAEAPVWQPLGRRSWADVWDRQLRWMVIRREQEPLAFLAEPLSTGAFAAAMAALAAPALGLPALAAVGFTALAWILSEAVFLVTRGWGFAPTMPLTVILRDWLILALWLRAWGTRQVVWRGSAHDVK